MNEPTVPQPNDPAHQELREMLGAFALGHLSDAEETRVRAHVEGCANCRAEVAEIAPLRGLLLTVDPDVFALPAAPSSRLGESIRSAVAAERHARSHRRTPTSWLGLAAAVVLIAALVGGVIGRATAPEADGVPEEVIALETVSGLGIEVDDAVLIDHTWGVELRFEAEGFAQGETYRTAFRSESGDWIPAGEFLGIGNASLLCNMQSSVLRGDVDRVRVTDAAGRSVAEAEL